ncbi:hypothetical protein D3C74_218860 [compost metagenome]
MKTYNDILKTLAKHRLPAPTFVLDELAERDEVIEGLNQRLTEKDATIKRMETALHTQQSYDKTASELYEDND